MSKKEYTLEEVKQLCKAAFDDGHVAGHYDEQSKDGDWWVENYLPETSEDGKAALNPFRETNDMKNGEVTKWIQDNYEVLTLNLEPKGKWESRYDNPAMKEKMTTTEEINNNNNNPATEKIYDMDDELENDKMKKAMLKMSSENIARSLNKMDDEDDGKYDDNPTWTGNWVWTDDKVKEAIQYIIHHREKEWYGVSYHLKEFKLNDWFKQIGLKKDRIFKSNNEEVIMTSGELKQLINLLQDK